MNIFTALQIIGWAAFALLVFALVVGIVTSAIKQIIREVYSCKTMMLKLMDNEQEAAKAVNKRIEAALGQKS